jgi:DDE domain
LLAERGIMVSYETVRRWVNHFGPLIAVDLRKRRPKPHTIWRLDEVYLKIAGRMVYLWRAVDAEGEVLDVLVQSRRNKRAALKLMRKLLSRAAARVLAKPGFHRIIWAPRHLDYGAAAVPDAAMRDPLDVVARFDSQLPTDKIDGDSLSKFVDFLIQHLLRTATASEKPQAIESDARVYLYHAQDDMDYAIALADALQERRIETILPAFEGPQVEINSFHRKNLVECDAVALCWAHASEVWVRAQSADLRDWRGLGRKNPFMYRGVIAGPPPGNRKKNSKHLFSRSEIDIIVDLEDKDRPVPELLDPLVPTPT